MKKTISVFFVLAFLTSSLLFAQDQEQEQAQEKAAQEYINTEYRINANDLLEIIVFGEESLNNKYRVDSDGTVLFPLLERVSVMGLTKREIEKKITELLAKDYLVDPQVSIQILEYARFTISGQVIKPGSCELKPGMTVMEAIAVAGGLTNKANSKDVRIIRAKDKEKSTINLNLEDLLSGKAKNVALEAGDLLYIGSIEGDIKSSDFIVVIGQVKSPGRYPYKKDMTVVEAIALAGGFTNVASPDGTRIIRSEKDKKKIIRVSVNAILQGRGQAKDIALEPNDTISVPESFF